MNPVAIILGSVIALGLVVIAVVLFNGLWFRALVSGTYVGVWKILRIKLKKLDAKLIVMSYIKAHKSGVVVTIDQLENHVQARGNIENVVDACMTAVNARIDLPVNVAMAVDLAGQDIFKAVKETVIPRVIETPAVSAVCQSGIEMSARAKVTIKRNLDRIIGGALEDTIIARVSEGIVTCIGNAKSHTDLLERPDKISRELISRELIGKNFSNDTAFDVMSIDISKIEIGRNVGAELDIDKAEAEKLVAQAQAEKRRTEALADEQEMRTLTQEMRARVVQSEALLPQALASAVARGKMTLKEYYDLDNLLADTSMRKKIGGVEQQDMLPAPKKKSRLA